MSHPKRLILAEFILIIIYILICSNILFGNPHVGLADNGDFWRVNRIVGIKDSSSYFYNSQRYFEYETKKIVKPEYFSTQIPVVKLSKVLSIHFEGTKKYDIHFLGLLYLLISSAGLFLLFDGLRRLLPQYFFILSAIIVFIFSDVGYISYYNSFFGEASLLSFLLLFFGGTIFIISLNKINIFTLSAITILALFFIGSKEANAPSGVFLSLFILTMSFFTKQKSKKVLILASFLIVLGFSFYCYKSIPKEIRMINQYQTITQGILKNSNNPKKDLIDIGIDPKFSVIANTTYYEANLPYKQDSYELINGFYKKFSYFNVLKYYLTHPKRFYEKLQITANNSYFIRPTYLGNYQFSDTKERFTFEKRYSLWSTLKREYAPRNLIFIFIYFILFSIFNIYELIRTYKLHDKRYFILACLVAFNAITAAVQFVVPLIGDGEADLDKHLFYYNVNSDIIFAISITYIIYNAAKLIKYIKSRSLFRNMIIKSVSIVLLLCLVFVPLSIRYINDNKPSHTIKINSFIKFGKYNNSPILWQVYYNDKNHIKLISYNVLIKKQFSIADPNNQNPERAIFGSNNWKTSILRDWLNNSNGFLSSFSVSERMLLVNYTHKSLVSTVDINKSDGGIRPHLWSDIPEDLIQNYQNAYYQIVSDRVWLPDAVDIEQIIKSHISLRKKDIYNVYTGYWLSMPYATSPSMVRFIDTDGFVYHKDAINKNLGIVPCIYLPSDIKIISGNGTYNHPFIVK